ncbi:hypothetical protein K492DRAFT_146118 [Lichtheimia hyalospora FSU 10163]|nr:hypothetical protein K492DRAFT_146118 [Lichtheimia hyalospora FSU 10163]
MRVLFATTFATLLSMVVAAGTSDAATDDNPYKVIELVDGSNFCTFLPPTDSTDRNIASTEYMGNAFCTGNTPQAKSAGSLADGFILSAHYSQTKDFVQVTGQIDPAKMNLNVTDEGGQYDIAMPKQATCAGWKHFVNLIEPLGHTYCVRCCHSRDYCNRGISSKGCAHIVEGDYSGPYNPDDDLVPSPAASGSDAAASSSAAPVASGSGNSDSSVGAVSPSSSANPSSNNNNGDNTSAAPSSSANNASGDKNEVLQAQSVDGDDSSAAATTIINNLAVVFGASVAAIAMFI